MKAAVCVVLCLLIGGLFAFLAAEPEETSFLNSLGMRMVRVEPGQFLMGEESSYADWDEEPVHLVRITRAFYVSETEVTVEQFRQFRSAYSAEGENRFATGISWNDAVAFCNWLSEKEGRPYRLPTEAEWEYCARAGTETPYWTGNSSPEYRDENPWGIRNMHLGPPEWCLDWYGAYPGGEQTDPLGPKRGMTRVVRGGSVDVQGGRYNSSANRGSFAPGFGMRLQGSSPGRALGRHRIGFRVVAGEMPDSTLLSPVASRATEFVKSTGDLVRNGPDPAKPYFRRRFRLPTPPENSSNEEIFQAGRPPVFMGHNHSPGLVVCPNGDLLMVTYSAQDRPLEYEPEVAFLAARLRFGAEEWDFPDLFVDFVDSNDHSPLLWNDRGTVHLFWGNPRCAGAFPFQWISSKDSGRTWSEVRFPYFPDPPDRYLEQPINSAFRDPEGTMYLASDAAEEVPGSLLWASRDDGATWYDTGGRSRGLHSTFVLLKDGRILGMGRQAPIDGFLPISISENGGKSWIVKKSPFPTLSWNQRPTILRLQSGRILFAGDFQDVAGNRPEGVREWGSYVALSEDEGETWRIKTLPGTLPHDYSGLPHGTLGYAVAAQAPNGVIHLITSMNRPSLHFAFNEAWVLSEGNGVPEESGEHSGARRILQVNRHAEAYEDGTLRGQWSGGPADDGRFLLHGEERWYYPSGAHRYRATYELGRLVGLESHWREDGTLIWQRKHREDGTTVWTQYWPDGSRRARSVWRDFQAEGRAVRWDRSGTLVSDVRFANGVRVD